MKIKRVPCPCCGSLVFSDRNFPGSFDICPVCFWEDDNIQFNDPDFSGGANGPSLNQARENFKKFGAKEERVKEYTRPPRPEEIPPKA